MTLRPRLKRLRLDQRIAVPSVLAIALLAIAAHAPQASAHAYFEASSPAPGKRVQHSPRRITLKFTEELNISLTKATIVSLATGKAVAAEKLPARDPRELILKPATPLPKAAYRVDWFSVSTSDGHALAGQFSFGVKTAAVGGVQSVQEGPLTGGGWWRIVLRASFYAALFFFAGGLFTAVLLSGREGRAAWLVPAGRLHSLLKARGADPAPIAARAWRRTVQAGWISVALAALVVLAEAANAAGGLSPSGLDDYLLSNLAGISRVVTVLGLLAAALCIQRQPTLAAACCAEAFLALSLAGHADSANPSAIAVPSDWIHLIAGAVWLGGIAQLALTWGRPLVRERGALGRRVAGEVLSRFGRVALPAFGVVLISGLLSTLIELGSPAELWESSYGRALAVKIGLVVAVAAISCVHARRLRPRLSAAKPDSDPKIERRHWLLLRREPLVGLGVLVAAALLVSFPLPPRQAADTALAQSLVACRPFCPLPSAKAEQLPVADHLGSAIVAAWLRPEAGGLRGHLRLLGDNLKPLAGRPSISGARLEECGPGCWAFELRGSPAGFEVRAPVDGHLCSARLPARWISGARANKRARRLLTSAQETMAALRSVRQRELITSGPNTFALTDYQVRAPNRLASQTRNGPASVVIGKREWLRATDETPWHFGRFRNGEGGFQSLSWFAWTPYAQAVRLLGVSGRTAQIALYEPGAPIWWRLRIDLATRHVTASEAIARSEFFTERYYDFNQPVEISAPTEGHRGSNG